MSLFCHIFDVDYMKTAYASLGILTLLLFLLFSVKTKDSRPHALMVFFFPRWCYVDFHKNSHLKMIVLFASRGNKILKETNSTRTATYPFLVFACQKSSSELPNEFLQAYKLPSTWVSLPPFSSPYQDSSSELPNISEGMHQCSTSDYVQTGGQVQPWVLWPDCKFVSPNVRFQYLLCNLTFSVQICFANKIRRQGLNFFAHLTIIIMCMLEKPIDLLEIKALWMDNCTLVVFQQNKNPEK